MAEIDNVETYDAEKVLYLLTVETRNTGMSRPDRVSLCAFIVPAKWSDPYNCRTDNLFNIT
jgi:hypothetical protein